MEEGSGGQAKEALAEVGGAKFTIGGVVIRSCGLWLRNLGPLALVTCLLYSPVIVYAAIATAGHPSLETVATLVPIRAAGWALLPFLAGAVLVLPVMSILRGEGYAWGKSLRLGASSLGRAAGVALVSALIVGIPALVLSFSLLLFGDWVILVSIAARIALVVVVCMVWLAVPIAAVETPGLIASFVRSAALTKGSRLGIFVILFALGLIEEGRAELLDAAFVRDYPTDAQASFDVGVTLASHILIASFAAVLQAVSYHDLTKRRLALEEEGSR